MSPMNRVLEGDVLVHHLTQDERIIDQSLLAQRGHSGRTLVKQGPLRLTLVAIGPGSELPLHSAAGPVTMHVTEGEIVFSALGRDYTVKTGDVFVLAPGVEHSARSVTGGVFLLTVVFDDYRAADS